MHGFCASGREGAGYIAYAELDDVPAGILLLELFDFSCDVCKQI